MNDATRAALSMGGRSRTSLSKCSEFGFTASLHYDPVQTFPNLSRISAAPAVVPRISAPRATVLQCYWRRAATLPGTIAAGVP
jgi:hypothetical protein